MGEFDDLLGDVIAEQPAAPESEYLAKAEPPADDAEFYNDEWLAKFIDGTNRAVPEAIADSVIQRGYAAVTWHFRKAALMGDIDKARALKLWLDWAQPLINKPKHDGERIVNPGTAAFAPREVK